MDECGLLVFCIWLTLVAPSPAYFTLLAPFRVDHRYMTIISHFPVPTLSFEHAVTLTITPLRPLFALDIVSLHIAHFCISYRASVSISIAQRLAISRPRVRNGGQDAIRAGKWIVRDRRGPQHQCESRQFVTFINECLRNIQHCWSSLISLLISWTRPLPASWSERALCT